MALADVLEVYGCSEVDAMAVYTDIFRLGQGLIQRNNEPPNDEVKTTPLVYMKNDHNETGRYRILFEDEFEEMLEESYDYDFAILNGLTYFGRKMTLAKASKMFALIIDLDGQNDKTLKNFMSGASSREFKIYPMPNYFSLSGHNVHLIYVFDEPLSLYPNTKAQLKEFKYALIRKVWNKYTSTLDSVQYQGINQGFRPIGGMTKLEGVCVRAFATGQPHWSIEELNEYLPQESRLDKDSRFAASRMSFDEAQLKFPEWAASLNEDKPRAIWHVSRNLYEWSKRKVLEGASYHHRYFSLMLMCMCAQKCSYYDAKKNPNPVTLEELERDIQAIRPFLDTLNPDEPMTDADISSALECFDPAFVTFPREDIERLTAIPMPQRRRNYRTQELHLRGARAIQEINDPNGSWRNKEGRPTKRDEVLSYVATHPELSQRQVAINLGVSRNTVNKWVQWAEQNPTEKGE